MGLPVTSRMPGSRYLGNASGRMEVHDLNNEQAGCQIETVIADRTAVIFLPDTLQRARLEGFAACRWCIGASPP